MTGLGKFMSELNMRCRERRFVEAFSMVAFIDRKQWDLSDVDLFYATSRLASALIQGFTEAEVLRTVDMDFSKRIRDVVGSRSASEFTRTMTEITGSCPPETGPHDDLRTQISTLMSTRAEGRTLILPRSAAAFFHCVTLNPALSDGPALEEAVRLQNESPFFSVSLYDEKTRTLRMYGHVVLFADVNKPAWADRIGGDDAR